VIVHGTEPNEELGGIKPSPKSEVVYLNVPQTNIRGGLIGCPTLTAGFRLQTTGFREQKNSRTIEDNRSTILPSASGQCSSVVLWLYQRLNAYPSSLVGFAVRRVGPCYDRGVSRWYAVLESIEIGPPHHGSRLQASGVRLQANSQTAERLRTISQHLFHQRLVSVHQRF
jgi:hypothetical protein